MSVGSLEPGDLIVDEEAVTGRPELLETLSFVVAIETDAVRASIRLLTYFDCKGQLHIRAPHSWNKAVNVIRYV